MFSFQHQDSEGENSYRLVAALFLRLLAVIYFIAFFTMTFQIVGLAGGNGILPLAPWLDRLLIELDGSAYLFYPMLFWFEQSDVFLEAVAWAGCLFSLLLFFNRFPRINLVLLFVCYLSLVKAGQTFMNFQWDGLLLEAGFLAIFLRPDSKIMVFLFRWLLFRLRFMSGISKLAMNDPSWLGMTALLYYFETQPLPHVGAWYFHNLPETLLVAATVAVLIIEIIVPFMMFLRRRYRLTAAWITLGFQVLILASSNHNWFNLLSMALCLFLFDDKALRTVLPARVQQMLERGWQRRTARPQGMLTVNANTVMAGILVLAGSLTVVRMTITDNLGRYINDGLDVLQAWHIVNSYHVFPTMTTRQIELKIEGSLDGIHWQPYDFIHRPNDPAQRPTIVLPHHPRLDWMVWFVPFSPRFLPWFDAFLVSLLENSPDVTAMLKDNPFGDKAPRFVRVHAWHYQFTSPAERDRTGHWWKRSYLGLFPPLPGKQRLEPLAE